MQTTQSNTMRLTSQAFNASTNSFVNAYLQYNRITS